MKRPKNIELVRSMEVAFKLRAQFQFLAFIYRVVMIIIW